MSRGIDHLVTMANQIGRAFAHRPHAQAVEEIAAHIKSFWEKRMVAQIQAHIDAGGQELDALPKESFLRLRK